MAEIDGELVERVTRWCAEAGRKAGTSSVRAALAPLGWDELLAVKALLADPPPTRPLGPHALVDLARGVPADVAAEREREGRYGEEAAEDAEPAAHAEPREADAERPRRASPRRRARAPFVIHRARDRVTPEIPAAADPLRPLEELFRPEGRSVLERLVRTGGARRARLAAALAAGWRTAAGTPASADDLAALLEEHGLARAFERRERDETLHAVRAAGGLLGAAAERLGVDAAGLASTVARLGIGAEVERIREERRRDLRSRATLSERVRLLLEDAPRLHDLGLEAEIEDDLRARLPEHVRALQGGAEPIPAALSRTLSIPREAADALVARLGLAFPTPRTSRPRGAAPRPSGTRTVSPRRPSAPPRAGGPGRLDRTPRPPAAGRPPKPSGARQGERAGPRAVPSASRPGGRAPVARPGSAPLRPRPPAGAASRGPGGRPGATSRPPGRKIPGSPLARGGPPPRPGASAAPRTGGARPPRRPRR